MPNFHAFWSWQRYCVQIKTKKAKQFQKPINFENFTTSKNNKYEFSMNIVSLYDYF